MCRLAPNTPSLVQLIAENGPEVEAVAQELEAKRLDNDASRILAAELKASVGRMQAFLAKPNVHLSSWGQEMWGRKIRNCEAAIVALDPDGQK